VDTVAALSVFRLQCPLSTALRVAYGGRYSTEALDTLRGLCDLIEWNDRSDDLEDQTLLFRHPDIAREYLAEEGVSTEQQTVAVLQPAIEALVDSAGDRWLAETLSATVLHRGAKNKRDFEWRLDAIEMIPPQFEAQAARFSITGVAFSSWRPDMHDLTTRIARTSCVVLCAT